jgi:hypothetical protein
LAVDLVRLTVIPAIVYHNTYGHRIGCLRGQSCLGRYKDRHDRSACPLTTVVLDDHASITKSLVASQQTIQVISNRWPPSDAFLLFSFFSGPFHHRQTSLTQTHPPGSDTYAIKLVDNDLIVETQQVYAAPIIIHEQNLISIKDK